MNVRITHVHLEGSPEDNQHITKYQWLNELNNNSGVSDKPTMVDWIDVKKNKAYVGSGTSKVPVGVIRPDNGTPYLRTYADGQWNNNLLSLPRF